MLLKTECATRGHAQHQGGMHEAISCIHKIDNNKSKNK